MEWDIARCPPNKLFNHLPSQFPPGIKVHSRFDAWSRSGAIEPIALKISANIIVTKFTCCGG